MRNLKHFQRLFFIFLALVFFLSIVQSTDPQSQISQLESDLSSAGYSWLVNYSVDYSSINNSKVEVYQKDGTELLALFENIRNDNYTKIYLTNLTGEEDTFDLRSVGDIEYDYVVDPGYCSGSYNTSCSGLSEGTCGSTSGCEWFTDSCVGEATECSSISNFEGCDGQTGCSPSCSGDTFSCSSIPEEYCTSYSGCGPFTGGVCQGSNTFSCSDLSANECGNVIEGCFSCTGTTSSCSSFPTSSCAYQDGCMVFGGCDGDGRRGLSVPGGLPDPAPGPGDQCPPGWV